MKREEQGQVMIVGILLIWLFVLVAAGLMDGFFLLQARNWGYMVAQEAARAGVSASRDWSSITNCQISLDGAVANNTAVNIINQEMALRRISGYIAQVRVLPAPGGGVLAGWPPQAVRLGAGRGNWSSPAPAVGVYLSFPVSTFLMSLVGRASVTINIFAASAVAQPVVCP